MKSILQGFLVGILLAVVGSPLAFEVYHSPGKFTDTAVIVGADGTPATVTGGKLDVNAAAITVSAVNVAGTLSTSAVTVTPISATTLPLPTGAATAANQTTGNSSLANIDASTKIVAARAGIQAAFGEQLMGQLYPQFQHTCEYTVSNTDMLTQTVTGSGSATQANGECVVTTGTTTGSTATLRTTHHARYRAGLGSVERFSAMFTSPVAGTEQCMGLMDEPGVGAEFKNGLAICYRGTSLQLVRWQNDTAVVVDRVNWDDQLNGLGPSGVNLDFTKLNVFYIQYQYLGAGAIRFWAENPATGSPFIFHTIQYANTATVPSTYNPNYHLTQWVSNGATTSAIALSTASFAFFQEGMTKYIEIQQPQFSTGSLTKAAVTTEVPVFTIRNKATYAGKTNYIDILLERMASSVEASSTNNLATCRIVKNATLGGVPVWSNINLNNSVVEIDTSATSLSGGSTYISQELAGKDDKGVEDLLDYLILIHPNDTMTLACLSANSATVHGSLLWKELF